MLTSLVFAPVFFNSPFFVFPPRHADGTREGFDGGLSCHSAFFVSPPRHTGGTRQVFLRTVCLIIVTYSDCDSFNYFLRVFPGFMARTFRGVGVGFEEPHLRFMV